MSYDLLVVGGTGQWFLMQLALRRAAELPKRFWVVDRDFGDRGDKKFAAQLKSVLTKRGLHTADLPNSDSAPAMPINGEKNIDQWLGANPARRHDVLTVSLSSFERTMDVDQGFHALPRLGAVWASVHGFDGPGATSSGGDAVKYPKCFEEQVLQSEDAGPLVIVGSVGGGTGAGLLPLLLRRARTAPPSTWKRPVILIALLPWFNPALARAHQGVGVDWPMTCRNAAQGVRALFRVMEDLERQGAGQTGLSWTECMFVGPATAEAEEREPPDPADSVRRGHVADELAVVVDALPNLISGPRSVEIRPPFGIGTIQTAVGKVGDRPFPMSTLATAYSGLRAAELASVPFELAAKGLPGVPRTEGLRDYLGGAVRSVALAKYLQRAKFIAGFASRLNERAAVALMQLGKEGSNAFSKTAATDIDRLVEDLDKSTTLEQRHELWRTSDVNLPADLDGTIAERKGHEAADLVFDALLEQATTMFSSDRNGTINRLKNISISRQRVLPTNRDVVEDTDLATFCLFRPGERNEERDKEREKLADALEKAGLVDTTFASCAYATALSSSHLLTHRVARLAATPAEDDSKIRLVRLLWRGVLNGAIEFRPVEAERIAHLSPTENLAASFPGIKTLFYRNSVVGFTSAEIGFVPLVDALDDVGTVGIPADIGNLQAEIDSTLADDARLLEAFAERMRHEIGAGADQIPWLRLLRGPVPPAAAEAVRLLETRTKNGLKFELRSANGGLVNVSVPLKADSVAVDLVIWAAQEKAEMWKTLPFAGVTTIAFSPWGDTGEEIMRFVDDGSGPAYMYVNHTVLARAVRAVRKPATTSA